MAANKYKSGETPQEGDIVRMERGADTFHVKQNQICRVSRIDGAGEFVNVVVLSDPEQLLHGGFFTDRFSKIA